MGVPSPRAAATMWSRDRSSSLSLAQSPAPQNHGQCHGVVFSQPLHLEVAFLQQQIAKTSLKPVSVGVRIFPKANLFIASKKKCAYHEEENTC